MGCKKNLFGEDRNCKGVVAKLAASKSMHTTKVFEADARSGQGDIVLAARITEAGTSLCTPDHNENVVVVISEAGTSSYISIFSPSATLTASENATLDAEKKYTHAEDIDRNFIPRPGMSFRDQDAARAFYKVYVGKVGFGLSYGNIKPYSYIINCNYEGINDYYKKDEELRVRNNTSKKTHMSKMKLKRIYDENKNEVSVVIEQVNLMHNHPFLKKPEETVNMLEHKEKDPVVLELVDGLQEVDVPHDSIQNYVRDMHGGSENVPMTTKDLENRMAANVKAEHANDISKLLEFFEDYSARNPQFRWYVKLNKEGAIHSLFWSHASLQAKYIDFGEVITFDTTHKTNIYDKPLALFVGANHHLQNTYFGCAPLGDETKETFQWVFQAFKKCMRENRTKSVLTGKSNFFLQSGIHLVKFDVVFV